MNFRFYSPDIVELLLSFSTSRLPAVRIIPVVEPFSTILDDAVKAADALRAQDSFKITKKESQPIKHISRKAALRGSLGRIKRIP